MELVTLEVLFMIFFGAIVTDFITGVLVAAVVMVCFVQSVSALC